MAETRFKTKGRMELEIMFELLSGALSHLLPGREDSRAYPKSMLDEAFGYTKDTLREAEISPEETTRLLWRIDGALELCKALANHSVMLPPPTALERLLVKYVARNVIPKRWMRPIRIFIWRIRFLPTGKFGRGPKLNR